MIEIEELVERLRFLGIDIIDFDERMGSIELSDSVLIVYDDSLRIVPKNCSLSKTVILTNLTIDNIAQGIRNVQHRMQRRAQEQETQKEMFINEHLKDFKFVSSPAFYFDKNNKLNQVMIFPSSSLIIRIFIADNSIFVTINGVPAQKISQLIGVF